MEGRTLQALVDAAPAALAVVGRDHTIRAWNAAAAAITGWRAEQVLGRLDPMVPEARRERTDEVLEEWLGATRDPQRAVVPRLRADGSTFQLCVESVTAVTLDDGPGLAIWFSEATALDALVLHRNQLSRRLVDATRIDEVLPILTEAVQDVLGAADAVLLRRCPSGAHLHGVHGLGTTTGGVEEVQLDLGGDEPWDDALDGQLRDGMLGVGDGAVAASFVPMGPDGAGWVMAVHGTRAEGSGAHVQDLFRAIADEAWTALQRVALVSELDGKIEILEATSRLAGSVGLDLEAALVAVTQQAAEALSCQRAAVYLVDAATGVVELAHVHASDASPQELLAREDGLALARAVVDAGERVLHQDVTGCEVADGPWHPDAGTVAVMGLPLRVANRTVGVLVAAHTVAQPRGFTPLCMQVGDAVAQQAALAVEHARLFKTERRNVERLQESDRLKADWMAGVTHDLKAPVTTLLGFVETLRRMTGHVSEEQQRHFLGIMSRQADRLVGLIDDLLLSARVEADAAARRREHVDVGELAAEAVGTMEQSDRERIEVRGGESGATVMGDRAHLQRVLVNLIANGLVHGGDRVQVEVGHEDGRVLVVIEDNGPGVPEQSREQIFDRFVHGDHESSSGLGLYVARGIVEAHEGTITVTDRVDGAAGARFELRLPRRGPHEDGHAAAPPEDRRRPGPLRGRAG